MSWFKIDDRSHHNAKVLAAGNEAWGAFCRAGAWASENLTDGHVPFSVALTISKKKIWKKLSEVGLVVEEKTGFRIPKFLEYNPSAEEVRESRAQISKTRAEIGRRGGLAKAENAPSKASKPPSKQAGKPMANGWQTPWQNPSPDPDPDPDPKQRSESESESTHPRPAESGRQNPEPKQVGPSHTTATVPNPSPLAVPGPRAAETTSPATLAAPEPKKPVLVQRGAKVADLGKGIDLDQPMAAWAMPRYEAIRMAKGISLDVPGEWLAFVTHLATLREQGVVRPVCEAEWSKWIQNADRFGGKSRAAPAAAKPPPPSPKAPEPEVYIPTDEERATFFANLRALSSAPIELTTVPLEPTEKRKPSEAEVAAFEAKRAKALAKAKLAFPDDFEDV